MRHASVFHRAAVAGALLLAATAAGAQQPPIERAMTPEQFKAAGLDKLTPAELAALNAWLDRTVEAESTKAAQQAEQKVKEETRGFFAFGSTEPIVSRITGEFRGFGSGKSYTLENGQVWQQVDGATLPGVRLESPEVRITPALIGNVWYMAVGRYGTRAKVQRTK